MVFGHVNSKRLFWLLLAGVLVLLAASPFMADFDCDGQTSVGVDECQALVALYNAAGGESWNNSAGWLQNNDLCTWYGVSCVDGHIATLDLNNNNLSGNLPIEIGGFPYLSTLTLNDNPLTGPLPLTITYLDLDLFHFQGTMLCEPVDPGFQDWFSQVVYRFSSGQYCATLEPTATMDPNLPWPQQTLTAMAIGNVSAFATATPQLASTRVSGSSTQQAFYNTDFGEGMGSFGGTDETGTKPLAASGRGGGFLSNIPTTWLLLAAVPVALIAAGVYLELRERKQEAPPQMDDDVDLADRLGGGEKKVEKKADKQKDDDNFGDFDMYDFGGN